jgi:HlyD family secretion protein
MKSTNHQVESLFDAARLLTDPASREVFLEQACAGDLELRLLRQGIVTAVLPAIEGGAAKFLIDLAHPSDPELRQNLRVDVHVVVAAKDGVPSVERGPFASGGASQPVFVVDGDRLVRRQVQFGLTGYDRLEIANGAAVGDEIVVSDMQDYAHLQSVRLR